MVGEKLDFVIDIVEEDAGVQFVALDGAEVDGVGFALVLLEDCSLRVEVYSHTDHRSFPKFERLN